MEQYLQFCRSNLTNLAHFRVVSIVTGNESCDLDSAVSAIVFAYVKYHELTSKCDNDSEIIVFPLLNVTREDLHLRREIVFWFEQVLQFDIKSLICRDEFDFNQLNSSNVEVSISLVDHNENKELSHILPKAKFDEILDHHKPTFSEGSCQVADPAHVLIDTSVGSCSSLVALRFLKTNIESKFSENHQEICSDSQIALILYGPILLDTICFSHSAKRFNIKDYEAVNKVEDLLKHTSEAEASLFDRNEVYQRLVDAKNSLDGLSFNELLRKDMKTVESVTDTNLTICISSITGTLLTELPLKENLNELKAFCNTPPSTAIFSPSRQRLFNAIVLLSLDNRIPNNLHRQLALFCSNKHLMRTIAICIERSELELEMITASETLRIYNQNNLTASRKVVLPIISTILNGPGTKTRSNDENAKRSEGVTNGNSDSIISHPSAPNSLIQAPDSYYGSFIEDSFVGEFVGDYMDPVNDSENILVMDADGQNLVMMNPSETSCISHTHEMEFDFDSFGPESIIYAGNVDAVNSKNTENDTCQTNDLNKTVTDNDKEEDDDNKELSNCDDSGFDKEIDSPTMSEEKIVSDEKSFSDDHQDNEVEQNEKVKIVEPEEDKMLSSNSIIEKSSSAQIDPLTEQNHHDTENDLNFQTKSEEVAKTDQMFGDNSLSSSHLSLNSAGSFSRNSTLTRSQRKKLVPQVKNLLWSSELNSPPVANLSDQKPFSADQTNQADVQNPNDPSENFIVSSQNTNQTKSSDSKAQQHTVISDPLGVNSLNDNMVNSNGIGLHRQPSMKKKIAVNLDLFIHENDDEEDFDKEKSEPKSNEIQEDINQENIKPVSESTEPVIIEDDSKTKISEIPQMSAKQEFEEDRAWRQSLPLANGETRSIDMKVIEPYKKVISHGGYMHGSADGRNIEGASSAIIVFSACFLPDRSRKDYSYVMDHLFMYVLTILHNLIADDYILIYLHNGGGNQQPSSANNMPTFSWLKRCYQMIDRKLKKNLKGLYLVHPTFWLKTLIIMSRPFISSKFSRKIKFVNSLKELSSMVPIENVSIPDQVKM